jgi:hypothetical protein
MKLHYYAPFGITYIIVKCFELLSDNDVDPNVRWKKYFGSGFTQENYYRFMGNMKSMDPSTYWLLLIAPNGLFIAIALLIISLII